MRNGFWKKGSEARENNRTKWGNRPARTEKKCFRTKTLPPNDQVEPYTYRRVGEVFTFGRYKQGEDDAKDNEPIAWRVLDTQKNKALLISEKILDFKAYDQSQREDVSWENCTLRKWLNEEFYNIAFNSREKTAIEETGLSNRNEEDQGPCIYGNGTVDKIFLLSFDDIFSYFYSNEDRTAQGTDYAKAKGLKPSGYYRNGSFWWLRSIGSSPASAGIVRDDGSQYSWEGHFCDNNASVTSANGIRPVFWMNLSAELKTHNDY